MYPAKLPVPFQRVLPDVRKDDVVPLVINTINKNRSYNRACIIRESRLLCR